MLSFECSSINPTPYSADFLMSSHHQFRDSQRGLGIAHRHSLAVFPAGPDAKTKVIAHPVNLFQNLRSVADENRSPDRF
jgi:hypothetical protein